MHDIFQPYSKHEEVSINNSQTHDQKHKLQRYAIHASKNRKALATITRLPSSTTFPVAATTVSRSTPAAAAAAPAILLVMVPSGWWLPFKLFAQLLIRFAHIRIAHVHFAEKVIRQPAVVVQSTQVGAANVTNLQFLVT